MGQGGGQAPGPFVKRQAAGVRPGAREEDLGMAAYDAIVVGAGVTSSAVARELSRRNGRLLVVERASGVCQGTS